MREISKKTCFSPQSEQPTANLFFFFFLKDFGGNSQRSSLFIPKMTISETSKEKLRKFVFLNKFDKGQILRKNWISLNNFF